MDVIRDVEEAIEGMVGDMLDIVEDVQAMVGEGTINETLELESLRQKLRDLGELQITCLSSLNISK